MVEETDTGLIYSACAALLNLDYPTIEIARLPYPLFSPEHDWELNGKVNNVVFPTGTALLEIPYISITVQPMNKLPVLPYVCQH